MNVKELSSLLVVDESTASRVAKILTEKKFTASVPSAHDKRSKNLTLTSEGRAVVQEIDLYTNGLVRNTLERLSEKEREQIAEGLGLYAKALREARRLSEFAIRPIQKTDNPGLARLIRTVMPEFGAEGPGYAINDEEVDRMFESYRGKKHYYLVVEKDGQLVGGGGIGPLLGGKNDTCELKKMYLYPEGRGCGIGSLIVQELLKEAKGFGYRQCYLETLERMEGANHLYHKLGFKRLSKPLGATGHFSTDRWYLRGV